MQANISIGNSLVFKKKPSVIFLKKHEKSNDNVNIFLRVYKQSKAVQLLRTKKSPSTIFLSEKKLFAEQSESIKRVQSTDNEAQGDEG
ncbi:hypothetical protein T12_8616 [Trichinella patagoniensis]|uniref:Uncharacterized protein n=1 Tax=Trichinella patagoniensis TaxID=990121 RepID=A0A0V1AB58_9BILA|nr:hypothetical protein T12_8616 [Trichinella patagoniensis]